MADATADISAIDDLAREIEEVQRVLIARLGERGYQLLRAEVPKVTTNLQQGVAPPDVDFENLTAMLTVSARSARTGASSGTLHLPSGKTRSVKLRPQKEFNYAETVAKGRPAISPKRAKVLLIPVSSPPSGGSYITAGGKTFILRPSAKAVAPNPFDLRVAEKLENESTVIAGQTLSEIFD